MPRDILIGTLYPDSWGTAGTQAMKPSPHKEGLRDYAGRLADREAFLAFQQGDTFVSQANALLYWFQSDDQYHLLDRWHVYYGGWHPQLFIYLWHGFSGASPSVLPSYVAISLGSIDIGTHLFQSGLTGGEQIHWYFRMPQNFVAGEYAFSVYGRAAEANHYMTAMTCNWLPTCKP